MAGQVNFRLAFPSDDKALRNLLRRNRMPGSISLSMCNDPSFFEAIEVEGSRSKVVVCEDSGEIVGMGVISERDVFVNGIPEKMGYISRLRLDKDYRSGTQLKRGYQYFKAIHEKHFNLPSYLTTILESNTHAVDTLTSGRAGLPDYKKISGYSTLAIPTLPRLKHSSSLIKIVNGKDIGVDTVIEHLQRFGKRKQFYPVYKKEDITGHEGILRGLNLSDFFVAKEGNSIKGIIALWDQRAFRPNIVESYSGLLKYFRKPFKFLPPAHSVVPALHAACIAIENNDSSIFKALLRHVLAETRNRDAGLLLLGFAENDSLLKVSNKFLHIKIKSSIYSVTWNSPQPFEVENTMVPYLELGSL